MSKSKLRPAVFLDRDGTILNETGYLGDPKKMRFYADAFKGLKLLAEKKIPVIVISNQSGIGRGYFTQADFNRVNRAFLAALKKKGIRITGVYICPHAPEAGCACRKPKIGLLLKAARKHHLDLRRSFVVGDQDRDVQLAHHARATGVLVLTGKGKSYRQAAVRTRSHIATKLSAASAWILSKMSGGKWVH